jgi:hypothetical protein
MRILYYSGFVMLFMGIAVVLFDNAHINHAPSPAALLLFNTGSVIACIGMILCVMAWIAALIRTARHRQWGWFAALLLLNFAMWLYLREWPDDPPK